MAMTPLSVAQINTAIISQIETNIAATVPLLPLAFVRVLAKAFAGGIVLLYKYTSFIWLQLFVATCSDKLSTISGVPVVPLTAWGNLVGAGDPVPAVPTEMTATVTVITPTGDPISSGTPLVNNTTGVIYLTTATVLKDAPTKTINIVASSDQTGGDGLGAIGNMTVGDLVSFTSPIADIVWSTVPIASIVTSGEDAEPTPQYRQRVIDRFQKRPQGGALADYEIWAEEAAGIINAYPYTASPGAVNVYCEADPVSSGSPDGIPTAPQLAAAQASIDLDVAGRATRRPANALATTLPITRKTFEVEVYGWSAPDPATSQAAVVDGMDTFFAAFEPYIGGLSVTDLGRITQAQVGGEVWDIARAHGATFSSVLLKSQTTTNPTFSAFVVASSDDAVETGGAVALTGAVLAMVPANTVGVRFTNVSVPTGAVIVSATLTFTPPSVKNVYSVMTVRGEAEANPTTFTAAANDITSRVTTTSTVEWVPAAWAINVAASVDITTIVADILTIPAWVANNAMVFTVTSAAGSDREGRSYDDSPSQSPKLEIVYTADSAAVTPIEVVTLGIGQKAKVTSVTFP